MLFATYDSTEMYLHSFGAVKNQGFWLDPAGQSVIVCPARIERATYALEAVKIDDKKHVELLFLLE